MKAAKDRTLGGPAVVASLMVLLLMLVSVGRHRSSLGSGLFITDIALLLGYGGFSAWVWRERRPNWRQALNAGVQAGLILSVVLLASHSIELFIPFEGRAVQLVRGAGSVLLTLGLLGAAGSMAFHRTRSILLTAIAGLWCGTLATLALLGYAFTLNLVFETHAASLLREPFAASGMNDAGAFLVRNSLQAASEILIRMPIAALMLSLAGGLSNAWIGTWPRSLTVLTALFLPILLGAGAAALWHADSLERAARPPFVMAGVLTAGIALCCAHPIGAYLCRRYGEAE